MAHLDFLFVFTFIIVRGGSEKGRGWLAINNSNDPFINETWLNIYLYFYRESLTGIDFCWLSLAAVASFVTKAGHHAINVKVS